MTTPGSVVQRVPPPPTLNTVKGAQLAGAVVTGAEEGLTVWGDTSHWQRVMMVWAGPVCAYTGTVLLQLAPLFTEYCKVEPAGQGVPVGGEIPPPVATQALLQVLLTTVTFGGAVANNGQQTVPVLP